MAFDMTGSRLAIAARSRSRNMTSMTASAAMAFKIGGELEVTRLGYGAMRITGRGFWGPPADRDEARRSIPKLGKSPRRTAPRPVRSRSPGC
jgi:hypothetical protein